ncbi:hypothetical protein MMC26_007447 [Xylographa opegraphella]|nr:hypothetical protein [Xylographa opegraphella]
MHHPTFVNIISFFYPLGNTPAVCLTQDLPPQQKANVLLLGCGDVRSILFTTYADKDARSRHIDYTCCDHEPAVLGMYFRLLVNARITASSARNILLLTLILDYTDGSKDTSIWNIYYHLLLDDESLALLQTQAQKLFSLSASFQKWHTSKYGKLLKMCDQGTLFRTRKIWNSYGASTWNANDRRSFNQRCETGLKKAREMQASNLGSGMNLTGFRSAAPLSILAVDDLPKLYQHFWKHGVTDTDHGIMSKSKIPNPMFFVSADDAFTLHYGTDPLLGFHLAIAYAPLTPGSPFELSEKSQLAPAVAAARLEFRTWSTSFRKCELNLTVRFFAGDALAFCHTLQHMNVRGNGSKSDWYRDQYHLEPLVLDSDEYVSEGSAPTIFNVIDTSNLLDHLGAMNLLVATGPLLEHTILATLYTEALVTKQKDLKALVDNILCGHFQSLSIIFGLLPIEYWTNSTATSSVEEHLLDSVMGKKEVAAGQTHSRLTWKRRVVDSHSLKSIYFDEAELASVLYQVYLNMFENEDLRRVFSQVNLHTFSNQSLLHYHRGSLASFFCFVKSRVVTDWSKAMSGFIRLVEHDTTLLMGGNYIQELYLQLYLHDLYTLPAFELPFDHFTRSQASNSLGSWTNIPTSICITLKVPRAKVAQITGIPWTKLGTPILHGVLQSSSNSSGPQWQNIFGGLQLAFGEISSSESRQDDHFQITIAEDVHGWKGHSPLLVSFLVPSLIIMQEPRTATVALGIQSTPQSVLTFRESLGIEMNIYKTTLDDLDHVYLTKFRPNLSGHASVCNFEYSSQKGSQASNNEIASSVRANVDLKTRQIKSLTGRLDIISGSIKSRLISGATVETAQISPDTIGIDIGDNGPKLNIIFPVPVLGFRSKSRIARKSSYVEVEVPMAAPRDGDGFPHFMYPMFPSKNGPIIWNMPYLALDLLPRLNTSKKKQLEWLTAHTSLMMSSRERQLRESSIASSKIPQKDARVDLKDSLFSLFMHFSGVQGQQARVFGINDPDQGGVHILVFVSCLKLDLANHTVVLDAAVLPLHTSLMAKIEAFLGKVMQMGFCNIKVNNDELRLWKQMLPAWVERCRDWEHRTSCQYLTTSKIPLSIENGENPLCSCGEGSLPPKYILGIPRWELAAKYAVRAAISPSFSVPFVEQSFQGNNEAGRVASTKADCRSCGKSGSDDGGKGLLKCSRCQAVRYCSVECQRTDWKRHKEECSK